MINLLFNAVDAMPQGGTITVATGTENNSVVIQVRDTGRGMTEEVRQRCFEPFFTTKGERGTGLGLAIVYGIVQRHGGSIDAQSEPGKGTVVVIRLPIPQSDDGELVASSAAPTRPLRVLLAEDEPQVRDIEAEYLRGDGHFVETAANGQEAMERFVQWGYDVVVADRAMPEMNGDKLAAAIKQISPKTPVIMVTGFADMPGGGNRCVTPAGRGFAQTHHPNDLATGHRSGSGASASARQAWPDPGPLRIAGTQAALWECQRMDIYMSKIKVLIVDDDIAASRLLAVGLEKTGAFQVIVGECGDPRRLDGA